MSEGEVQALSTRNSNGIFRVATVSKIQHLCFIINALAYCVCLSLTYMYATQCATKPHTG